MRAIDWNKGPAAPTPVIKEYYLGLPRYTYNIEVQTDDEGYKWLSHRLPQETWDRSSIISSIIRMRYSADEVEAIVNNILAKPTDRSRVAEYLGLQEWRAKAKKYATELMSYVTEHNIEPEFVLPEEGEAYEPEELSSAPDGIEQMIQAISLAMVQAADLPDDQAADLPALFPTWASKIGESVTAGERLYYDGRLWKVLQDHTVQADWTPTVATSLFTEVAQQQGDAEVGTLDNPIPYSGNMELEEGKYYSQDGVVYLCIRSTGTPVYHPLAQLVGLYVEVVEQS